MVLGKDAAQVISRINGFTYVKTEFDFFTGKVNVVEEIPIFKRRKKQKLDVMVQMMLEKV